MVFNFIVIYQFVIKIFNQGQFRDIIFGRTQPSRHNDDICIFLQLLQ